MTGDRRAAGAVEHGEEGALAGERGGGVAVIDGGQQRARARVVVARLDRDDPLPNRGQKFLGRQNRRGGVGEPSRFSPASASNVAATSPASSLR